MQLTYAFLRTYWTAIVALSPLLLAFLAVIIVAGLVIGRFEKWQRLDAIYFAFVTATTLGYGDMRPAHHVSRLIAIFIALTGILLTGVLVSICVYSVGEAMEVVGLK